MYTACRALRLFYLSLFLTASRMDLTQYPRTVFAAGARTALGSRIWRQKRFPPPKKNELVLSFQTGCVDTVPFQPKPNTPFVASLEPSEPMFCPQLLEPRRSRLQRIRRQAARCLVAARGHGRRQSLTKKKILLGAHLDVWNYEGVAVAVWGYDAATMPYGSRPLAAWSL